MISIAISKHQASIFMRIIADSVKKAIKQFLSFKPSNLLSDDIKYSIYFHRSFTPELYRRHVSTGNSNCIFCRNLVKSEYHKYCLICSKGAYNKCYLPLPSLLYEDLVTSDNEDMLQKPWYFMKTCSNFERLPKKQYLRNLHFPFSQITIQNYEALEGLENGISSGTKPCYICASIDYELYKRCKRQGNFDTCSPCHIVKNELMYTYENHQSYIRPVG